LSSSDENDHGAERDHRAANRSSVDREIREPIADGLRIDQRQRHAAHPGEHQQEPDETEQRPDQDEWRRRRLHAPEADA